MLFVVVVEILIGQQECPIYTIDLQNNVFENVIHYLMNRVWYSLHQIAYGGSFLFST